jgi:serine phosphatase RsbU (regulator of sigma subunit)/anti-sigma regulatory factor (Ser/Thr protein kinase)/anti-anti-sigma regulatory factor
MSDDDLDRLVGPADKVRRVYDATPLLLGTFGGPEHRLVTCNAAFRAFFPLAVMGEPLVDVAPMLHSQGIIAMYDRVYDTGEPLDARDLRVQVDLDGSGTREVFVNITVIPDRDEEGRIAGVVLAATDVTESVRERQSVERRAREMAGRFESIRDSATLMQRALLPAGVPILPGADIAASYLVAAQDTAAGGDWFDALADPAGNVVLIVGDVVGHGVEAAAVMAQLRTAIRMQMSAGAAVAEALEALERFAVQIPGARFATVCVARLNAATGDFEYCTAGHPPPLVVDASGVPRYLEPTGAGPLGSGRAYAVRSVHLDVADIVLLYSDGLVERPGRQPAASTTEIADVTVRVLRGEGYPLDPSQVPVERLCSQAVEMLVRFTGYSDDITLIAAQRRTAPAPLHIEAPADGAERVVRAGLREWLTQQGAAFANAQLLEHAVTEFVTNVADHAYRDVAGGPVVVDAVLSADGTARVTVTDRGTWREHAGASGNRGRGLAIAQTLVPDTVVTHGADGTVAVATHRLLRDAHVVTDPYIAFEPPTPVFTDFEVWVDDGVVGVTGDVDTRAAPTLAGVLSTRSRAGSQSIDVDLSAVTHLGSAAVSVLAEARQRADRQHTSLTLVAPPGGTAHHVLSLVGLPTSTGR